MAFGFVFITVLLFLSVAVLVKNLTAGNKKVSDLPVVFKSEARHLSFILSFFSFTYMVRFVSDFWIAPIITAPDTFGPCVLNDGLETLCSPAGVIYFYVWISCVFDFMPLSVIIYFHHKSFRHDVGKAGT